MSEQNVIEFQKKNRYAQWANIFEIVIGKSFANENNKKHIRRIGIL